MSLVKSINLLTLFLIEVAVLAAAVAFGWHQHQAVAVRLLIGVVIALAFAMSWAVDAAPRAKNRLRGTNLVAFEVVWFGVGVGLLVAAGHSGWAVALAVVVIVSKALGALWHQ
jgi:hypothetical protein